jgi:hypothetical protein
MTKKEPPQAGKVRLLWLGGSPRIGIVPQHQPAPMDRLLALGQGYAELVPLDLPTLANKRE